MNKKLLLFFLILTAPLAGYDPCLCRDTNIIPEFKVSSFRPYSNQIRCVFSKQITKYDFDLSYRLAPGVFAWSGIGFWQKKGFSVPCQLHSRIAVIPATLGVKFTACPIPCLRLFVGVGARYDYVRVKTKLDTCTYERKDKGDVGVALTGGFQLDLAAGLYISPFFEYSKNKITHRKISSGILYRSIEVGGFNAGIGIGAWL